MRQGHSVVNINNDKYGKPFEEPSLKVMSQLKGPQSMIKISFLFITVEQSVEGSLSSELPVILLYTVRQDDRTARVE